jgi:hypothetical protein
MEGIGSIGRDLLERAVEIGSRLGFIGPEDDSRKVSTAGKTQGSLPSEDAAVVLLFSLVASGQIRLRRIDGWQKIATVLRQQTPRAA